MTTARKLTIVVAGTDESAMDDALAEVMRLMKQGNLSGGNQNDSGGFYFDSTSDVPASELPAGC